MTAVSLVIWKSLPNFDDISNMVAEHAARQQKVKPVVFREINWLYKRVFPLEFLSVEEDWITTRDFLESQKANKKRKAAKFKFSVCVL